MYSYILFASLWEVRARKGLIVPAAGGGNRATNNTKITKIYKQKKNSKSWEVKLLSKIQCFGTILHFPAQTTAKFSTDAITFQAASARTHFRGVVMGSNIDFMEIAW